MRGCAVVASSHRRVKAVGWIPACVDPSVFGVVPAQTVSGSWCGESPPKRVGLAREAQPICGSGRSPPGRGLLRVDVLVDPRTRGAAGRDVRSPVDPRPCGVVGRTSVACRTPAVDPRTRGAPLDATNMSSSGPGRCPRGRENIGQSPRAGRSTRLISSRTVDPRACGDRVSRSIQAMLSLRFISCVGGCPSELDWAVVDPRCSVPAG